MTQNQMMSHITRIAKQCSVEADNSKDALAEVVEPIETNLEALELGLKARLKQVNSERSRINTMLKMLKGLKHRLGLGSASKAALGEVSVATS